MPYLVRVKTESLRRLVAGWFKQGKEIRRVKKGVILEKLSGRLYIFDTSKDAVDLILELLGRHPQNVDVYTITKRTPDYMVKKSLKFKK